MMSTTESPVTLGAADSLLRSASWHAEKLFKQHSNFSSVLFIAEYADGTRQRLQRSCNNAPNGVSDANLLADLAQDVALDFAEAKVAVTRFAPRADANALVYTPSSVCTLVVRDDQICK